MRLGLEISLLDSIYLFASFSAKLTPPPKSKSKLHLSCVVCGRLARPAIHCSPSFRIRIATAPVTAPTKRARPVAGGSQQKGLEDVWAHVLRLDHPVRSVVVVVVVGWLGGAACV